MNRPLPKTAIIGAGMSGLVSGKMLSDYRIPYRCFELSDRVGGNWAFDNPNGQSSAYRSLHIDTSKQRLAFQDFPMPSEYADYPHHSEVNGYLENYAETFNLKHNISFENGVTHAERRPEGGWDLTTQDGNTEQFDALVVANGHHWDPRYPQFPGRFTGTTLHSHHYVDPSTPLALTGKRILVVGIGNSAADITSELSQRALQNTVTISTRSGAWIIPKYLFGIPMDRLSHTIPQIPVSWQRRIARKVPVLISGPPEHYGLPRPDHNFQEAHPTMSSELLLRLGSGDATAKPNIDRFDGETVHFVDGTAADFDVVIFATGYNITFPFFDEQFVSAPDNQIRLYKRMFKPGINDLIFMGLAQSLPTFFPFVECQSRLLGAYLSGHYRLPEDAEMEETIHADEKVYLSHFANRARHTQQVDFYLYEHNMTRKELPAGQRRAERFGPVNLHRSAVVEMQSSDA